MEVQQASLFGSEACIQTKPSLGAIRHGYLEFSATRPNVNDGDLFIKLDNSSAASKRKAASSDDFSYLKRPSELIIKITNPPFLMDFYFYFPEIGSAVIRDVDFRVFWPTKIPVSGTPEHHGVQRLKTHLAEYERRAIVFETNWVRDSITPAFSQALRVQRDLNFDFMVVTNNCRSPGAFEFEILGHLKGYFQFPLKKYLELYSEFEQTYSCQEKKWQPFDFRDAKTEYRVSRFYDQGSEGFPQNFKDRLVWLWSKFFEKDFQWYSLGDFSSITQQASALYKVYGFSKPATEVKLTKASGVINYDEMPSETAMKSNFVRRLESYAYIQTPCKPNKENPPAGLQLPYRFENFSMGQFWQSGQCLLVPILIKEWEEVEKFDLYLSKFEIDGVYTGKTRNRTEENEKNYNTYLLTSKKDRMPYQFNKYIGSFHKAYLELNDGRFALRLENSQGFDIVIGNVNLENLKREYATKREQTNFERMHHFHHLVRGLESLIGLDPKPLVSLVSWHTNEFEEERPLVSFLVDQKTGKIVNHHDQKFGLEQFILRLEEKKLIVDLISHERIIPVGRFELDCDFCQL